MKLNDKQLAELAKIVADTAAAEIDCEEMLERSAAYLDALTHASSNNPAMLRQVTQHLRICAECREEFDLLLRAKGIDPAIFDVKQKNI